MTTHDTRGQCPTCHRDFALTKNRALRAHGRPHPDEPWRKVACEGSGQPSARTFTPDARIEAAILRWAAEKLLAHPGPISYRPQLDEDGGFWWDTRDRDAAAVLLTQWANEIHPA